MRKLNPNLARSIKIPKGFAGSLEINGILLMARARPKMISERDSILDLAMRTELPLVTLSKTF